MSSRTDGLTFETTVCVFSDWLDAIHEAGDSRDEVIAGFIEAYRKPVTMIWRRVCYARKLPYAYHDDAWQEAMSDIITEVSRMADDPAVADKVRNGYFPGWVEGRMRNIVQRLQEGVTGVAPLSGTASARRRVLAARKVSADLAAEWGREPTLEEVIERQRQRIEGRPSGATSRNMLVVPHELVDGALGWPADMVQYEELPMTGDHTMEEPPGTPDGLAFPWVSDVNGGPGFIDAILRKADERLQPAQASILRTALGGREVVNGKVLPVLLTSHEVKNRTGKTLKEIDAARVHLKSLAVEVLEDYINDEPALRRSMQRYLDA